MPGDDLSVSEAADALATSPQTVRALLRKGELSGRQQPWGSRYVWVVSRSGVDDFLAEHGRLDGHRRRREARGPQQGRATEPEREQTDDGLTLLDALGAPPPGPGTVADPEAWDRRPFVLRPRGRATVLVLVLGLPLLLCYVAARLYPDILWFEEVGQPDVLRRVLAARVEWYLVVVVVAAGFVGANLAVALRRTAVVRTPVGVVSMAAASLLVGTAIASSADNHWQTFLLWRHGQTFGVVDPVHGKDIGFFVFSLPMELLVWRLLVWLVVMTVGFVLVVYLIEGQISRRPRHATLGAQVHLASLGAILLLLVAWRFDLERYLLELGQPSADRRSFAGATYVDIHARLPGFAVMTTFALLLAGLCAAAPFVARAVSVRAGLLLVSVSGALLLAGTVAVAAVIPSVLQRYEVDPSPLLREQPYLERSISATRSALGLDAVDVEPYEPRDFTAADFPAVRKRLANVLIWDTTLLESRMRELVTDTPYYAPQPPMLDPVRIDGRRQLTVVSSRELDPSLLGEAPATWISDRLSYTHGLGLLRFSGTDTDPERGPRLLGARRGGLREPRIYFGNLPDPRATTWVVADTRRPEIDVLGSDADPATTYHYDGTGGIELSSWVRRLAFSLSLGSKEMLLSDDITPRSRLLLHRDVHDRLRALAPFVEWDSAAVPLTAEGHIVYVVDGYTTSGTYPYAQRVDLGGRSVSYARSSIRATVDAFTGQVRLYLVDDADPVARAWADAFPTLFRPGEEFPAELARRLRYPVDLFHAQATAYETFHTTRPDLFISDADAWSRPLTLAGPLEVAGDIDFDESDEDDLRQTMQPGYYFSPPPGATRPRLILGTYYTPRRGQNLVASLLGWVDEEGRARLVSRNLPRDPVSLGPAQVSRLVFATPRVRNLLGLRNLEIRDLDKSSLDAVWLGHPHPVFLPDGIIQVQSLYEGSRGPGAARLLGVTTFLNGRAGLGPDIESAARQALNDPPALDVAPPEGPAVVGTPVQIAFRVQNTHRETVTITSPGGRVTKELAVGSGQGTVAWMPTEPGTVRVRVNADGLDGTAVTDQTVFAVLSAAPTVRLVHPPTRAVVGRPVRVSFVVRGGVRESAEVRTRSGIGFSRSYRIRNGTGVVTWTPRITGPAALILRVVGGQGQTARAQLRLDVVPPPEAAPTPSVTLLEVPRTVTIGNPSEIAFLAADCRTAQAQIEGPRHENGVWRFPCRTSPMRFTWTPTVPGRYLLTTMARGGRTTVQASTRLRAERP